MFLETVCVNLNIDGLSVAPSFPRTVELLHSSTFTCEHKLLSQYPQEWPCHPVARRAVSWHLSSFITLKICLNLWAKAMYFQSGPNQCPSTTSVAGPGNFCSEIYLTHNLSSRAPLLGWLSICLNTNDSLMIVWNSLPNPSRSDLRRYLSRNLTLLTPFQHLTRDYYRLHISNSKNALLKLICTVDDVRRKNSGLGAREYEFKSGFLHFPSLWLVKLLDVSNDHQ